MGGCVAALGLLPSSAFGGAVVAIGGGELMKALINGAFLAILQARVPPAHPGRVFAVIGSAVQMASPLGLALAGPLADLFNVRAGFVLAGLVAIALGIAGFRILVFLRLEEQTPWTADQPAAPPRGPRIRSR